MSDSSPELPRDFIIKVIIEELPKLVKESDPLKGAIISALSGVMATKEDIENLGKQMIEGFREMDKRFEAMDKRFEAILKQREEDRVETNRRFEAMDKRFDAMLKKWEQDRAETNRRFEAIEKRFEEHEKSNQKEFEKLNAKLDHLIEAIGKPFEQFGRNVITRILEGEEIKVHLVQRKFPNPYMDIFDSHEIEIDGFSESPPILVEITTIDHHKEKIERFIRKKKALEKIFGHSFRGFFVCSSSQLTQDEKAEMILLLKQNNTELINL